MPEGLRVGTAITGWYCDYRRHGQFPGEPADEQAPADAWVATRCRSSASGSLRGLQWNARVELRTEIPTRQRFMSARGDRGLTPKRSHRGIDSRQSSRVTAFGTRSTFSYSAFSINTTDCVKTRVRACDTQERFAEDPHRARRCREIRSSDSNDASCRYGLEFHTV